MALFSRKKLSDEERQSWSAQLLEVRQAELDRWGELPTLGNTWEEHDSEYNRLYAFEYFPKYGILANSEMQADGLRLSGYRRFLFEGGRGGFLLLVDELEDRPPELSKGEVIWVINLRTGEDGVDVYGYQKVSDSWKYAKSYMMDKVKAWQLENFRKGLIWDQFFNWTAIGILALTLVIALVPIIGGAALGIVLGEAINVGAFIGAASGAVAGAIASYEAIPFAAIENTLGLGADEGWIGLDDQVNQGVLVFVGNQLTEQSEAPPGPSESAGGFPLLLAAAAALIFI